MPLVSKSGLPTFSRLKQEGATVLTSEEAERQDIRELHIGLLNMMPDAALQATERQFYRLVGESNQIAQFYMHPFTLKELERGEQAKAYIDTYYDSFEKHQAGWTRCADHHRRQRHPPRSRVRTILGATDRSHRLGLRTRDVDTVLLPRHPCGVAVPFRPAAASAAGEVLGRLQSPRH
jgi:hypothetical protein